jgi:uncharacterized DUF497 family protein
VEVPWDADSDDHIGRRHHVQWSEVEEALLPPIVIERVQRGAHRVLGVTFAGRHLAIFVRLDSAGNAVKLITARTMTDGERKIYRRRRRKG